MTEDTTDLACRRRLAAAIDSEDRSLARKVDAVRQAQRSGLITSHEAADMIQMAKLVRDLTTRALRTFVRAGE